MRDHDPLTALLKLLDEERDYLLAGETDALSDLATRKEKLAASVAATRPSQNDLIRLARAMSRQEALLKASRDGFENAQTRLKQVRSVRSGLNHYTRNGKVETISATGSVIEKRA